jgi:hypothetical protein
LKVNQNAGEAASNNRYLLHAGFLLGLFLDPEYADMFLRNVTSKMGYINQTQHKSSARAKKTLNYKAPQVFKVFL